MSTAYGATKKPRGVFQAAFFKALLPYRRTWKTG